MSRKKLRFSLLIFFGIALVSFAIFYIQLVLARPIGSGPAGPKVTRERFEKQWSDKLVRVVGIGDSITAGLGARSKDHTFFNRLINNPNDEYADMKGICLSSVLSQLTYENLAISGSTSLQHMDVIEDRLTVQDANVFGLIVMTTGGNDLIHSYGRSPPREGAMYGATLEQAEPCIEFGSTTCSQRSMRASLAAAKSTLETFTIRQMESGMPPAFICLPGKTDLPSTPSTTKRLLSAPKQSQMSMSSRCIRPLWDTAPIVASFGDRHTDQMIPITGSMKISRTQMTVVTMPFDEYFSTRFQSTPC